MSLQSKYRLFQVSYIVNLVHLCSRSTAALLSLPLRPCKVPFWKLLHSSGVQDISSARMLSLVVTFERFNIARNHPQSRSQVYNIHGALADSSMLHLNPAGVPIISHIPDTSTRIIHSTICPNVHRSWNFQECFETGMFWVTRKFKFEPFDPSSSSERFTWVSLELSTFITRMFTGICMERVNKY